MNAETWTRFDVWIPSGSERLAAWLYRPAPARETAPCIVMAHGFGGVRELRLDAFAERFAAAGYVAIVFDYRHFGASDGVPRQILDIGKQHADWAAAVAFARGTAGVDPARIVLWGTSFGGGHVLVTAARDAAIAAVVAQVPHTNASAAMRTAPVGQVLRLVGAALRDFFGALVGRAPYYVPIFGAPGDVAAMTAPGALAAVERLRPPGFRERNDVAARVFLQIARYSPGRMAAQVRAPLLVLACEKDRLTPRADAEEAARRAPRGELIVYPIDHFDIYAGADFERAVQDTLAFLERHVPVPRD
jgi:dienelactone hydrolase